MTPFKSNDEKFKTVIEKNTFYFFNQQFEEKYEGYINSLKEILLLLKNRIEIEGLKRSLFENLLVEKENGLKAILALTGFSNEYFKRLITVMRIVDDNELSSLVYRNKWLPKEKLEDIREWSDVKILKMLTENAFFRKGIVNLFFEGASVPILINTLPLYELKKLSISKLNFEIPEMIDTLIRYKEKGSYSGKQENNPETIIANIFDDFNITYEKGDLNELIKNAPVIKRTMDFIVPNKLFPKIIIECSFLVTTSSGQGDKSKTEVSIRNLIREHYPSAHFYGFVDGIGWYVRRNDLIRMVEAHDDVFTFHKDEIERFKNIINKELQYNG